MKRYKFTILIGILVLLFTAKIVKTNMALSPDEVFEKAYSAKEGLDSIVQISNSSVNETTNNKPQLTLAEKEAKSKDLSNVIKVLKEQNKKNNEKDKDDDKKDKVFIENQYINKERFTIKEYTGTVASDFLVSKYIRHTSKDDEEVNEFYYRRKDNQGYISKNFGPWKKDDISYVDFNDYNKTLDIIKNFYEKCDLEEGDEYYLFSFNDETLKDSQALDIANELGLAQLIKESNLLDEDYLTKDWDYNRLTIKFVFSRSSMHLENITYDLELQKGDRRFNVQDTTNFEQFGIVREYTTPEELPEFNY